MYEEETEPRQMQFKHNKPEMGKTRIKQGNPEVTHRCLQLARRDKRHFCWGVWGCGRGLKGYSVPVNCKIGAKGLLPLKVKKSV